ncbi:hypothetical protein CHS0354_029360 [Potamilus streckersoni]|uniref:Uncharacterized protein n=1 Tax=Potamilus streckersoni TaxID=2493646 RepID=A0AAE0STT4_9BIVA|nr:hypothetical protein CHS0354_029360 [Potamilus streckersoni]
MFTDQEHVDNLQRKEVRPNAKHDGEGDTRWRRSTAAPNEAVSPVSRVNKETGRRRTTSTTGSTVVAG